MVLSSEISAGNILTTASIGISMIALLVSWSKDRKIKKKEYADRIRRAAGLVVAKMDRWVDLSLRFFADIQPLITDTDGIIIKEKDATLTRDFFWRGLVSAHASSTLRIVDEQIEIAYVDLYGYDPRIQTFFSSTIHRLRAIDDYIFGKVLTLTQEDILALNNPEDLISAQLGNAIRDICQSLNLESKALMEQAVKIFRIEMMKLIEANDTAIFNKEVNISIHKVIRSWDSLSINNEITNTEFEARRLYTECGPRRTTENVTEE